MLNKYLEQYEFMWPAMLWLLLLLPLLWLLPGRKPAAVSINRLPPGNFGKSWRIRLRRWPFHLKVAGCCLLVVALARPVRYEQITLTDGMGIDVVLCMDVSGSMLAQDFEPNRLAASQQVARRFVEQRPGDRIGLVIFSGQSFTLCPVTHDHAALLQQLEQVNYGLLADGTSIGSGLASAVERLRTSPAKSKVIVLLTDGEDTGGKIDPTTAKRLAASFGIKVYTIGVGTTGYAKMPYKTTMGTTVVEQEKVSIDEDLLRAIAAETGGQYYRATSTATLEGIYDAINNLEKSAVVTSTFRKRHEGLVHWLLAAIGVLALAWLLQQTVLRSIT
jgi:Ca-activated chloride channel family protein